MIDGDSDHSTATLRLVEALAGVGHWRYVLATEQVFWSDEVYRSERKSRIADLLDRFNMVAKKDLFPAQLSGRQQQLVGIARALIGNPKLILADEPTGNLQSQQAKEIMDVFKKLNEEDGVTIVQVTHSDANAQYGKRILHLMDGRVESEEIVTK